MYKDCYRDSLAFYGLFGSLTADYLSMCMQSNPRKNSSLSGFSEFVADWLVDNEYEISKYGIPESDVPADLDMGLFNPPAKKRTINAGPNVPQSVINGVRSLVEEHGDNVFKEGYNIEKKAFDRCPEDILREEVENK